MFLILIPIYINNKQLRQTKFHKIQMVIFTNNHLKTRQITDQTKQYLK